MYVCVAMLVLVSVYNYNFRIQGPIRPFTIDKNLSSDFHISEVTFNVGWIPMKPADNNKTNCALISVAWNGVTDWRCVNGEISPFSCSCKIPESHYNPKFVTPVFLILRGLCKYSNIDTYYYPMNFDNGDFGYGGLYKSVIFYNRTKNLWTISTGGVETMAFSTASFDGYVIGVNDWVIENDNFRCSKVH